MDWWGSNYEHVGVGDQDDSAVSLLQLCVYVRLTVQLDAHVFICVLYFTLFALHVSGAICTHPQEYKLQSTAIGMRNGYGMWEVGLPLAY
jgi:hypothetical protein